MTTCGTIYSNMWAHICLYVYKYMTTCDSSATSGLLCPEACSVRKTLRLHQLFALITMVVFSLSYLKPFSRYWEGVGGNFFLLHELIELIIMIYYIQPFYPAIYSLGVAPLWSWYPIYGPHGITYGAYML